MPHTATAPLFYGDGISGLLSSGVLNAAGSDSAGAADRSVAFWYLTVGLASLMIGALAWWIERRIGGVPAVLGWLLPAFTVWGVVLMPASGFWLFGIVAAMARRSARQLAAPPHPSDVEPEVDLKAR